MKISKKIIFCICLISFFYQGFAQKRKNRKKTEIVTEKPSNQYRQTTTGLLFKIHDDNQQTRTAKRGDLVSIHMIMSHNQAGELRNTYKEGKALLFPIRFSAFEADLNEGIKLLSSGDSATFLVLADSMYSSVFKKELPKNIKAGTFLRFDVKILDVKTQKQYLIEQKKKHDTYVIEHKVEIENRKKQQDLTIQEYIKDKGFKYKKTNNGVYYAIVEKGKGKNIRQGDAVIFHYVGSLLDDLTEFESTYQLGQPSAFTLGQGSVIPGWEEVFSLLTEGDICKIIVPSHLGFGHITKEKVPANSVLMFDIKIIGSK